MKTIIKAICEMLGAMFLIILGIMISACAFSIAYNVLSNMQFMDFLPRIPYSTWMAIMTICLVIYRFWPFKKSAAEKSQIDNVDLYSNEGISKVIGLYASQILYLISAMISFFIAAVI